MSTLAGFRSAGEQFVATRLEQLFEEVDLDEDVRKQLLEANKKLSKAKLSDKKGKTKDSSKPKQPQNGFMRFMDDARKILKEESPSKMIGDKLKKKVKEALKGLEKNDKGNVSSSEMSKKMGVVWKAASDAEKKGYNDAYKSAKEKLEKTESSESDKEEKPKKSKSKKDKEESDTCAAKTGKGEPCNKKAKEGSKYCGTHKKLEEEEKEEESQEEEKDEEEEVEVEDDE